MREFGVKIERLAKRIICYTCTILFGLFAQNRRNPFIFAENAKKGRKNNKTAQKGKYADITMPILSCVCRIIVPYCFIVLSAKFYSLYYLPCCLPSFYSLVLFGFLLAVARGMILMSSILFTRFIHLYSSLFAAIIMSAVCCGSNFCFAGSGFIHCSRTQTGSNRCISALQRHCQLCAVFYSATFFFTTIGRHRLIQTIGALPASPKRTTKV